MYDSITLDAIPAKPQAVAGYVNGRWPTFPELEKRWPQAARLSIAVTARANADCLDVENGDATPGQAPAWVKRQQARGIKRPVVYCSVSQAAAVLAALAKSGITRSQIRLWTAHYTGKAHRCDSACGLNGQADATQYTDKALGRNLDASLCAAGFLAVASKPASKPPVAPAAKPAPAPLSAPVAVLGPAGGKITRRPLRRILGLLPGLLGRFGKLTLRKKA